MSLYLLNPCPNCGLTLTFPGMPSSDYVIEGLMADSDGKCPECGEQVVLDQPPPPKPVRIDPLMAAMSAGDYRAVPVVDLPLTVRCRLAIIRLGVENLGELLKLTRNVAHDRLGEHLEYIEEVERLLDLHGIEW